MDLLTWLNKNELKWVVKDNMFRRSGDWVDITFPQEEDVEKIGNEEYFQWIVVHDFLPMVTRKNQITMFINYNESNKAFDFLQWLKYGKCYTFELQNGEGSKFSFEFI